MTQTISYKLFILSTLLLTAMEVQGGKTNIGDDDVGSENGLNQIDDHDFKSSSSSDKGSYQVDSIRFQDEYSGSERGLRSGSSSDLISELDDLKLVQADFGSLSQDNYEDVCSYKKNPCFSKIGAEVHENFRDHFVIDQTISYGSGSQAKSADDTVKPDFEIWQISKDLTCGFIVKAYAQQRFGEFVNEVRSFNALNESDNMGNLNVVIDGCMYDHHGFYILLKPLTSVLPLNHDNMLKSLAHAGNAERKVAYTDLAGKLGAIHQLNMTPLCLHANTIAMSEYKPRALDIIDLKNARSLAGKGAFEAKKRACRELLSKATPENYSAEHNDIINLVQMFVLLDPAIKAKFDSKHKNSTTYDKYRQKIYKSDGKTSIQYRLSKMVESACVEEKTSVREQAPSRRNTGFFGFLTCCDNFNGPTDVALDKIVSSYRCGGLHQLLLDILTSRKSLSASELAKKLNTMPDEEFSAANPNRTVAVFFKNTFMEAPSNLSKASASHPNKQQGPVSINRSDNRQFFLI